MSTRLDGRMRPDYVTDAERAWFPMLDELGIGALVDELVRRGEKGARAASIAWFVSAHRDGRPDHLSAPARSDYRRTLRAYEPPSPDAYDRRTIGG